MAVSARAVDGAATDAVLRAVAEAFALARRAVTLVSGRTARTKILDLEGDATALRQRLADLLEK